LQSIEVIIDGGGSSGAGSSLIADIRTFPGLFKIIISDFSVKGVQVIGFKAFVMEIFERRLPGECITASSLVQFLRLQKQVASRLWQKLTQMRCLHVSIE
jgi:hypothetical protein